MNSSSKKSPKKKKSKKPIGEIVDVSSTITIPYVFEMMFKKSSMKDL